MLKKKIVGSLLLVLIATITSCEGSKADKCKIYQILPPSPIRIHQFCSAYSKNNYDAIIGMVHQSNSFTAEYKTRVKYMLMQRVAERNRDSLFMDNVSMSKILLREETKSADVFLNVNYTNGNNEEIMIPMVYDEGKWWIR